MWKSKFRFLALFFTGALLASQGDPGSFMYGDLINEGKPKANPVLRFVGNFGVAIGDTAAQGLRFTSNILSLDFGGALKNVGNLGDRKSVNKILVQFIERLPEVLENDLHLTNEASTGGAIGTYLFDDNLDANEAASLLNTMIGKDMTRAQRDQFMDEMKGHVDTLLKGNPGMTVQQLGQSLSQSMRDAIEANPAPAIIGSPLSDQRTLRLTKSFFHSFIQNHGAHYVQGILHDPLKDLRAQGIDVSGLDEAEVVRLIESSIQHVGFDDCLRETREVGKIFEECFQKFPKQQDRIMGNVIRDLGPMFKNGDVKLTVRVPGDTNTRDVSGLLASTIENNKEGVDQLANHGTRSAINPLLNDFSSDFAYSWLRSTTDVAIYGNISRDSPAGQAHPGLSHQLSNSGEVLIRGFTDRLKLIPENSPDFVEDVEAIIESAEDKKAGGALDNRVRGPFEETLRSPEGRVALLEAFMAAAPFTKEARANMLSMYKKHVQGEAWSQTEDVGLKAQMSFLLGFNKSIEELASVPSDMSTLAYLKALGDKDAHLLKDIVLSSNPGLMDMYRHMVQCEDEQATCEIVAEPLNSYVKLIRQSRLALERSGKFPECRGRYESLLESAFREADANFEEIIKNPASLIRAYGQKEPQAALNCLMVGAIVSREQMELQVARNLFNSLESTLEHHPEKRMKIAENLYQYIRDGQEPGPSQQALLETTEEIAHDTFVDMAHNYIDQYSEGSGIFGSVLSNREQRQDTKNFSERFIRNTRFWDADPTLTVGEQFARFEKGAEPGTSIDTEIRRAMKATLSDPQTRMDLLEMGMEFNSPASTGGKGLLGSGLEQRLLEAYASSERHQNGVRFPEGTEPGIAGVLESFDESVRQFDQQIKEGESVGNFFMRVSDSDSRLVDGLIAQNADGMTDLLMGMMKCNNSKSELCRGCKGTDGSWVLPGQGGKPDEVLLQKPAGHVLEYLKLGLRPKFNNNLTKKCHAAMPKFIHSVVSQAADPSNKESVLKDPTVFLRALEEPKNQTVLNCVVSAMLEKEVFASARSKGIGWEAGARAILDKAGVSNKPGLFELTGDRVFEALEKQNANPALLKLKSDFVNATREQFSEDSFDHRHEMKTALADMTEGVFLAVATDDEFAHLMFRGEKIPAWLKRVAQSKPGDPGYNASKKADARRVLRCIEDRYRYAITPLALFGGKHLNYTIKGGLSDWVMDAPDSPRSKAIARRAASSGQGGASSPGALPTCKVPSGPASSAPTTKTASTRSKVKWVGGHQQSVKLAESIWAGSGKPQLSGWGERRVLERTLDYQRSINHAIGRGAYVRYGKGVLSDAGTALFEGTEYSGNFARAAGDIAGGLAWDEEKLLNSMLAKWKGVRRAGSHFSNRFRKMCAKQGSYWNHAAVRHHAVPAHLSEGGMTQSHGD